MPSNKPEETKPEETKPEETKPSGLQDSTERGGWNAFGTSYIGGSGNPYDS